jgi:hypothetical protein
MPDNEETRRIFGPKKEEQAGSWRKSHNENIHNLHSSLNIIRITKPRTIRWTGHVARMDLK